MTQPVSFECKVIEDPEAPGELMLDLGNEVCDRLGWSPGDTLQWENNGDGSWTLKKL